MDPREIKNKINELNRLLYNTDENYRKQKRLANQKYINKNYEKVREIQKKWRDKNPNYNKQHYQRKDN